MARSHVAPDVIASEPPPRVLESCPLCATTFDGAGQGCRPSCPLAQGCAVVCCPSCGYSFPQERGLAARLKRFLDRRSRPGAAE